MHQPLGLPSAVSTATDGPASHRNAHEGAPPSETSATAQPDPLCVPPTDVPSLATEPRILDRLVTELRDSGVVGEDRAAKLIYLIVTSRVLERPISAVLKGPSSAGKNHNVESVLRLFPPSSYYALTAMSERALAYSLEPLQHRVLVLYEAAGLRSDFGSYLIRSLLSEGRIRYETVETTKEGLRPRLIDKAGPTGLLITTTAIHLHPENETRLLSVPLNDSPQQTHRILKAMASEQGQKVDPTGWQALQHWIERAEHRVSIPYAFALAEAIPPVAVRLRRDFKTVLNLIQTHAILHQATRGHDAEGRIVATLTDYEAIRELVADLIAEGLEASVPPVMRDTVQAVKDLKSARKSVVNVTDVAAALNLDKSAALRRVRGAMKRGFLINRNEQRGQPYDLALGDPLPDDKAILPTLEALSGCTVADASGEGAPSREGSGGSV